MQKISKIIGIGVIASSMLLSGCSFNSEPKQGVNNEIHEVATPTANPDVPSSDIKGLPAGFPEGIPLVSDVYTDGSYSTFEANGNKNWVITLIATVDSDQLIKTQFETTAGWVYNDKVTQPGVFIFTDANYNVTIVKEGNNTYVYNISGLT